MLKWHKILSFILNENALQINYMLTTSILYYSELVYVHAH